MNKIKDFTDSERLYYQNIYSNIIMTMDDLSDLLDTDDFNSRFYTKKVHIIKSYLDKLDDADFKANKKDFLDFLKSDEKYKNEVLNYKSTIIRDLNKLELCNKCKCLKCISHCKFNKCLNCLPTNFVHNCNKENTLVAKGFNNVVLYSNDENRDVNFEVLGLLDSLDYKKKFIYLVEVTNRNNQHILEYVSYINGETEYTPVDEDTLDKVYNNFVKLDCYE